MSLNRFFDETHHLERRMYASKEEILKSPGDYVVCSNCLRWEGAVDVLRKTRTYCPRCGFLLFIEDPGLVKQIVYESLISDRTVV